MMKESKLRSLKNSIAEGLSEQEIDATTEYALKKHVIPANLEHEHLHGSVDTELSTASLQTYSDPACSSLRIETVRSMSSPQAEMQISLRGDDAGQSTADS